MLASKLSTYVLLPAFAIKIIIKLIQNMQKKSLFFLQFKKRLNRKAGGFTLVEIIVVVTIIIILFSIILFIVSQYVNRSKDSNIEGNLVILIPSGEAYYTGHGNNSYGEPGGHGESGVNNFCNS